MQLSFKAFLYSQTSDKRHFETVIFLDHCKQLNQTFSSQINEPLSHFTDQHLTSPCNMSMSGVRLWKVAMFLLSHADILRGLSHVPAPQTRTAS